LKPEKSKRRIMVSIDNGVALPYRTIYFKILENVKECKPAFVQSEL
jgi:hypothetical protein